MKPPRFGSTFYGINPKTMQIEGVSVINGKTISKWNGESYVEHPLTKDIELRDQIARRFKLTELVEVTPADEALGKTSAVLLALNQKRSPSSVEKTAISAPIKAFNEERS